MEQNQNSSLFELGVSSDAKSHLGEAAKWARFLAICGMISIVLLVIFGIIASLAVAKVSSEYDDVYRQSGMSSQGLGAGMMIFYVLFGLLYFFPCLFTLQFANKMKLALTSGDDLMLAESFRSLKKTFRYLGILTIIGLAFFIMALVTGGMAALTA
jgi:Family of unknown function (DUF5362)